MQIDAPIEPEIAEKTTTGEPKRPSEPPLKFKDAVGRKFTLPFHMVKTWAVS